MYGLQAVGCSHAINWNASRDITGLQAQSLQLAPSVKPLAPEEFFQIALSNATGAMMWTWWNSWISCWSSHLDIASLHDQELASITRKLYWRFFQRYSSLDMHDQDWVVLFQLVASSTHWVSCPCTYDIFLQMVEELSSIPSLLLFNQVARGPQFLPTY